jgi:hypothetical protein
MQEIHDVISFVGPIFGRSPGQIFAMAFLVLWFVLELVSAVVSARQQNQLDELSRDFRQQQLVLEEILEETSSPSYSIYPLAPGERSERRRRGESVVPRTEPTCRPTTRQF